MLPAVEMLFVARHQASVVVAVAVVAASVSLQPITDKFCILTVALPVVAVAVVAAGDPPLISVHHLAFNSNSNNDNNNSNNSSATKSQLLIMDC